MSRQRKADLLLVLATAFWGVSYYLLDLCLTELQPLTLNAFRFLTAFFVLGAIFFRKLRGISRRTLLASIPIGLCLVLTYIGCTYGVLYTSLSNAGFICALPVVVTPLLEWLFLRKRPDRRLAVALVLYMAAGHFFLKPLFARPRPCDINTSITMLVARPHGHSFPSGHTASGVAAAYALWLQNRKLGAPALVLAAFIAFTRLYLYVHFPTDVLGGAVLGIALGTAASAFANYMANRKKKQQIV